MNDTPYTTYIFIWLVLTLLGFVATCSTTERAGLKVSSPWIIMAGSLLFWYVLLFCIMTGIMQATLQKFKDGHRESVDINTLPEYDKDYLKSFEDEEDEDHV